MYSPRVAEHFGALENAARSPRSPASRAAESANARCIGGTDAPDLWTDSRLSPPPPRPPRARQAPRANRRSIQCPYSSRICITDGCYLDTGAWRRKTNAVVTGKRLAECSRPQECLSRSSDFRAIGDYERREKGESSERGNANSNATRRNGGRRDPQLNGSRSNFINIIKSEFN